MSSTETCTDRCVKCGKVGIPDTEISITTNPDLGPGVFGVCEDCSREDGVDPALAFKLAELRAGTLFCWWHNWVRQMPMRRDEDF